MPEGPPARRLHAIAYDSVRGVIVLRGGASRVQIPTIYNDTWEWDGQAWLERGGAPRYAHYSQAMAFDARRAVTVLYGGYLYPCPNCGWSDETWEWDGEEWRLAANTYPLGRDSTTLAFDDRRGVVVLFGGSIEGLLSDETWEWDGRWTQRPVPGPPARGGHSMAFDSTRGVVVVFGGFGYQGAFQDTWEFDGETWRLRPEPGPPGRYWHAMVFDAARRETVLFGGRNQSETFGDMWAWDGVRWRQLTPPLRPSPRFRHAMAYDSRRGVTVLHAGELDLNTVSSQTWEWDGAAWTLRAVTCFPDCDRSTGATVLDIFDFLCFQNFFAAGDPYACNCDFSTGTGVCDVFDFLCFQNAFAGGCP